jgi:arylsulfatase A-like enzyme
MSKLPKHSILGLCYVVWLINSTAEIVAAGKPNIIVIVSDDSGYNEFTMNGGNRLFPTPRIDSIAANGVRFPNGYVSGTVCSPTRAGLLTGRYQNRFGHEFNVPPVYSEDNGLSLKETTIADVLKSAEYRTIALGKWHLGYAPKFHPMQRGFTDYYGFLQGARSYFPLKKSTNLNQLLRDREPVPETFDYMTDELGRAAADYIAQSKDKPFFIYLAYNATHGPNEATPADLAIVKGGGGNEVHRAMSLALDRSVGLVLDELKKQSLTENTLIFYVNDNGGVTGHDNTPLRGFKGSTWEGGTRIPFAIQWPTALPRGQVFEAPVISLDIFPTAMAAAGIKASPGNPLDGVNLIPYLLDETKGRPHQTLYWKNGIKWAVRDGDLKAVFGNTEGQGKKKKQKKNDSKDEDDKPSTEIALFDLSKDGGETNNLAASRVNDVARLEKLYNEWKRDFPKPTWGGGEK